MHDQETSELPIPQFWTERLIIDLALGVSEASILDEYGMQAHQLKALLADKSFMAQVSAAKEGMAKDGVSFVTKARIIADDFLEVIYKMVNDPVTPANVRGRLIEDVVRWAGHEPRPGDAGGGARSGFSISINLGANTPAPMVTIEDQGL